MTPVRLEPAALQSRVEHSTTEPLRSQTLDIQSAVATLNIRSRSSKSNEPFLSAINVSMQVCCRKFTCSEDRAQKRLFYRVYF